LRRTRKSQMEILGLAFVFIILIFGLIIFLRLAKSPSDTSAKFTDPHLAASTVSSMLKTSVQCGYYTYSVTDLLKDCARSKMIFCSGTDSCTIANETMTSILEKTLVSRNKYYNFVVNSTNEEITSNYTGKCTTRAQGNFYQQPFDVSGHTLYINLKICDFN
jgi:hypothetical protein